MIDYNIYDYKKDKIFTVVLHYNTASNKNSLAFSSVPEKFNHIPKSILEEVFFSEALLKPIQNMPSHSLPGYLKNISSYLSDETTDSYKYAMEMLLEKYPEYIL